MADEDKQTEENEEAEAAVETVIKERPVFVCADEGENPPPEHIPLWLVTFTDVMALMLTFFVLLYSMAVPEESKWEDFSSAVTKGINKYQSSDWYSGLQEAVSINSISLGKALDLDYLEALVRQLIADSDRLEGVVIIPQKDRLIISLPSDLLFESGQAEVSAEGKRALFILGEQLYRIKNRVEIIGHADPRPIEGQNSDLSSNWELSLARAINTAAVLFDVGYERPITARGLSSSRYEQLPEDIDEEERLSLARRVDLVVMQDNGSRRNALNAY